MYLSLLSKNNLDGSQTNYKCKLVIESIFTLFVLITVRTVDVSRNGRRFAPTLFQSFSESVSSLIGSNKPNRLFQDYSIALSATQSLSISRQKDTCIYCISLWSLYRQRTFSFLSRRRHKWTN